MIELILIGSALIHLGSLVLIIDQRKRLAFYESLTIKWKVNYYELTGSRTEWCAAMREKLDWNTPAPGAEHE